MAHCALPIPQGDCDAAQKLGCDVHRRTAGLSFICGLPSSFASSSCVAKTLAEFQLAPEWQRIAEETEPLGTGTSEEIERLAPRRGTRVFVDKEMKMRLRELSGRFVKTR